MTKPLFDRSFAAVLFDLDGTLIDSTPAVLRSWGTWADVEGVDRSLLGQHHGVPAKGIVRALLPDNPERWDEAERRIEAIEVADTEGVVTLPGAVESLAALGVAHADGSEARETPLAAIATSCTTPLFAARSAAAGLPIPSIVVTADQVAHGKPDPEPYELAAERLGVSPRDCLVIEDAPSGLRSGKAAGCTTLALLSTTSREDLSATGDADVIVDTLASVRFEVTLDGVRVYAANEESSAR